MKVTGGGGGGGSGRAACPHLKYTVWLAPSSTSNLSGVEERGLAWTCPLGCLWMALLPLFGGGLKALGVSIHLDIEVLLYF